jgi:hypothetical protein
MSALLEVSKLKDIVSGTQYKSKESTSTEISKHKVSSFGRMCSRCICLILGGGDGNIGFVATYIIQGKYTQIKQVNKYID